MRRGWRHRRRAGGHAQEGKDWLCLATRAMVPALPELQALRDRFVELAEGRGGAYDGWGATVVEPTGEA